MKSSIIFLTVMACCSSGETYSQVSYPFGFQGMEREDEVRGEGNSYNTPLRQYDVRTGNWQSMDPVQKYHISPYVGLANNPLRYLDPLGADEEEAFELQLPDRGRVSVMGSEPWSYSLDIETDLDVEISQDDVPKEAHDFLEEPPPVDLRVYGIGRSASPRLLIGRDASLVDLTPYTGNHVADLFLSALEMLGIPILSYPQLSRYSSTSFRTVYAYSGGSPMVRNAFHYGILHAGQFHLYGAPGTYSPGYYDQPPDVSIHANADDLITWINLYYFNNPIAPGTSVPTFMQGITIPYEGLIEGLIEGSRMRGHTYQEFNEIPRRYRR